MKMEMDKIAIIAKLFETMVNNCNDFGAIWKNIDLGKKAFAMMESLPAVVEGEFDAPSQKAALLGQMLEQMDETSSPRFCIEVREYMQALDPDDGGNSSELERLHDFIDLDFPMEEYCAKYGKHLKFDPVERTQEWESVIYDVEKECAALLDKEPRGMGFCYMYWSTKADVLRRYGIHWHSPAAMNPGVLFD